MADVSPRWPHIALQRLGMWRRWQQSVTFRPATMQRAMEGSAEKHSCTMLMLWYLEANCWKLHRRWHLGATYSARQQSVKL